MCETQWVLWVYLGLFAFLDLSILALLCVYAYGYEE